MRRKVRDPSDGLKPLLSSRRELLLTIHPELPRDTFAQCQCNQGDGDDVLYATIINRGEKTKDHSLGILCTLILSPKLRNDMNDWRKHPSHGVRTRVSSRLRSVRGCTLQKSFHFQNNISRSIFCQDINQPGVCY